MYTKEQIIQRKLERKELKLKQIILTKINNEKNQKPVDSMIISIQWVKSRMYNSNPNATVQVLFKDGTALRDDTVFRCSGCGYDKESTVIGEIFNKYMKYKLWLIPYKQLKPDINKELKTWKRKIPYGIHAYSEDHRGYGQGIGTNCYYSIAKYIGGKFEDIAHGKTFDVYKYTDNK